jgi:hypothetical protein
MLTMKDPVESPLSTLQILHAVTFVGGLVGLVVAAVTMKPVWYLVSGPLLAASGALILFGCRIAFGGPIGSVLRIALGRGRIWRSTSRGLIWLLLGILVSIWGFVRAGSHETDELELDPGVAVSTHD